LFVDWVEIVQDLLFLSHRIPYPPDKGDKIRAWNILRHLSGRYRVHLGFFIDSPEDIRHVAQLEAMCGSVFWTTLSPSRARLRSLRGFLTGASLTQGYFGDPGFRKSVHLTIARHRPHLYFVFSSAMAPYVVNYASRRLVIDMVDVDSEKWRQYAEAGSAVARLIYAREGRNVLALECRAAAAADAVIFVSRSEAELFRGLAPQLAARVHAMSNGVDTDHFNPSIPLSNPLGDRAAIVFTGMMDYRPNVEAVIWFTNQVMPRLRAHPAAPCFWIVGANPSRAVLRLQGPDVRVTGRVVDVRPYLAHARAAVAPLRIGRGLQNKVLEAMAMAAPVVVSPQAREGLELCRDDELLTADTPASFAAAVAQLLGGDDRQIGLRARERVVRDYTWHAHLSVLDRLLDVKPAGQLQQSLDAARVMQSST
jgi:sugar transferase (PEP-CTERM/EpsH1 system associated)